MHKRPVVDETLQIFLAFLAKNGFYVSSQKVEYSFQYSCDVDTPVLCYQKSFPIFSRHAISSLIKHRSLKRFSSICKSMFNIDANPFYTFPWICNELAQNSLAGCFNFKGGASSLKHDSPYSLSAEWIKKLIAMLTRSGHEIGFHPSYRTPEDASAFKRELANVKRPHRYQFVEEDSTFFVFLAAQHGKCGTTRDWNTTPRWDSTKFPLPTGHCARIPRV